MAGEAVRRILRAFSVCAWLQLPGAAVAVADEPEQLGPAVHGMLALQQPGGLFEFDFDFVAGRSNGSGSTEVDQIRYIVREADLVYGLAKYFAATRDPALRAPLAAAIAALGAHSAAVRKPRLQAWIESSGILTWLPFGRITLARGLDRLGLLYGQGGDARMLAFERHPGTVWAGGTAIALLAEVTYAVAAGDQQFATLRAAWRDGLLLLRIPGAGFRGLLASPDEDPLADGEAWLALATLNRVAPAGMAATLRDIDDYLMRRYSDAPSFHFFNWGMMAAAARFAETGDRRFIDFVAAQADIFLDPAAVMADRAMAAGPDENTCFYVEGLVAAARVLRADGDSHAELLARVRTRIDSEMAKNHALQLQSGQSRIELGGGAYLWAPRAAGHAGAYLAGRYQPYTRVDLTGHCISALTDLQSLDPPAVNGK